MDGLHHISYSLILMVLGSGDEEEVTGLEVPVPVRSQDESGVITSGTLNFEA